MPKPLTKADILSITHSENSYSRKKSLTAYSNAVRMLLYSASAISGQGPVFAKATPWQAEHRDTFLFPHPAGGTMGKKSLNLR